MSDRRPTPGVRYLPDGRRTFERGNTVGERHGAYSERRIAPLARELVAGAVAHSPYLGEAAYAGELEAWSRAEARCFLLARYVDEHGPLDADGTPRPALAALTQQERLAGELRHRLGLTPLSRAKLGRDATATQVDLAALMARLAEEDRP